MYCSKCGKELNGNEKLCDVCGKKGILVNLKESADELNIGSMDDFVFCLPDGTALTRFRVENELKRIEKRMK